MLRLGLTQVLCKHRVLFSCSSNNRNNTKSSNTSYTSNNSCKGRYTLVNVWCSRFSKHFSCLGVNVFEEAYYSQILFGSECFWRKHIIPKWNFTGDIFPPLHSNKNRQNTCINTDVTLFIYLFIYLFIFYLINFCFICLITSISCCLFFYAAHQKVMLPLLQY